MLAGFLQEMGLLCVEWLKRIPVVRLSGTPAQL